jgi:pullulanase
MNLHYLSAKLVAPQLIFITLKSYSPFDTPKDFLLRIQDEEVQTLKLEKFNHSHGIFEWTVKPHQPIVLGMKYEIIIEGLGSVMLDVTNAQYFDTFDHMYTYEGDDLGATFATKQTRFNVWAPLASSVQLIIQHQGRMMTYPMQRDLQGVYRCVLEGNYEKALYRYEVTNSGIARVAVDPYAKGSTQNGEWSVVINFHAFPASPWLLKSPTLKQYTDAIIYETSVRDLTSDRLTNIVHKGRFLGLTESQATTSQGRPLGLDHLIKLGITHVQLLPIYDFKTVDEKDPHRFYNWGYDPAQYFVPEGSFASELEDPYSRIRDLKVLAATLHEHHIGVIMDVVFNHVYQFHLSNFEKVVPEYYFRRTHDYKMSNGSFCGNDVASDRPMVRKLIIDAALHWVKTYGIDGFRFDLMGIHDIETMQILQRTIQAIHPQFMFYGEGWNMPTALAENKRATMNNASQLPSFAFFNDAFRDTLKGATSSDRLNDQGFLNGSDAHRLGFKYVFSGSVLDLVFPARFTHAGQSINYVECHDNSTLFDKLSVANPDDTLEEKLKRIQLINAVVMVSFGIPLYHMGQEVGLTKHGDHNSYQSGDHINKMDVRYLDERAWMVDYFAALTQLRKRHEVFRLTNPKAIEAALTFEDLPLGAIRIDLKQTQHQPTLVIIINPSKQPLDVTFESPLQLYFTERGFLPTPLVQFKSTMIPPLSQYIFLA